MSRSVLLLILAVLAAPALAAPDWKPLAPGVAPKSAPRHAAVLDALPRGSVMHMRRSAGKSDGPWELHLHDGSRLPVEGVQRTVHANGDVSFVGTVARGGALYPALLTVGTEASFGTFKTPSGDYRFEAWGEDGWLVDLSHPRIALEAPDEGALAMPGFQPPPPRMLAKNDPLVIDVMFIYSQGIADRYPGSGTLTRINHLVAIANQIHANSEVNMVLRLVGAEFTAYPDSDGPNAAALNSMRLALQGGLTRPEFSELQSRRIALGADLVTFLRPHDVETRGNCGIAYLFANLHERGVNIVSDGFDSWSLCADEVFTHEVGHNLGAEHQNGANSADAGFGTAYVREGRLNTVMGSFGSGHPDRYRRIWRYSNPDTLCGGAPCGIPNVADNARRLRDNMAAVAAYRNSTSSVPVPSLPSVLDADVDGDGVPESQDAFPFDARYSSDSDGDGVPDEIDAFPNDPTEWADTDGDGIGDNSDTDIDGDGVTNEVDAFPYDGTEWADTDGDGFGDNSDAFVEDRREWRDTDGDGVGDNADADRDGDGVPDFMAGDSPESSDLLVISAGTDRVLRLDGDTGLFAGVEFAESHIPQALGFQSQLAWNPHQKLLYALVAGELRRYERASRQRVDRFLATFRQPPDSGEFMRSSFPGGLAVDHQGNAFIADDGTRILDRRESIRGFVSGIGVFGSTDFFQGSPRSLNLHGATLWSIDSSAAIQAVNTVSGNVTAALVPGDAGGVSVGYPADLATDPAGDAVMVADALGNRVVRVALGAQLGESTVFVAPGSGGLAFPAGLAFGPDGHLYVSSAGTDQVLRYDGSTGAFIDVFSRTPPGMLVEPRKLLFVPRVADRFPDRADRRFRPVGGGWYNPDRSGHGLDVQVAGDVMLVIWYTYTPDGEPTWYLGQSDLVSGVWESPLYRFTWDGSVATPVELGSMRLEFESERAGVFSWVLPEHSGSEPMQPLSVGSSSETQFPTAAWYDPAESGWGLSVSRQGESAYAIAFIYDPQGQPTWVLSVTLIEDDQDLFFATDRFFGPTRCPGCPGAADPEATPAGELLFRILDRNRAAVDTDFQGEALDWQRSDADFWRLTDSPTEPGGDPFEG